MLTPQQKEAILSMAFFQDLIKRSAEADQIAIDCGSIRLQRAALAAIELYEEKFREANT